MNAPDHWQATLHLEIRTRGGIQHRTYTAALPVDPAHPDSATLHMVRESTTFNGTFISKTTWHPAEVDPRARTAVFRESLRRSDRLVDDLELYGWVPA